MKYMLIPFMLIACGDKEEDSASSEAQEAVDTSSETAE